MHVGTRNARMAGAHDAPHARTAGVRGRAPGSRLPVMLYHGGRAGGACSTSCTVAAA